VRAPLETRCRPAETGCLGRELDRARGFAAGGLGVTLWLGPVVAVSHPYFDTRLKRDPDYLGKKDRFIAGRNAEAYLSVQGRFGEVFFGSVDRNWGPGGVEGLLLSPAPYGYDHLGLVVGTAGLRLEGILTQLDDLPDAGGVANHRYLVAHRLVVRPPGSVVISLWEGTIVAGPGRELEPWYANILSLGLLAQYDQGTSSNNQVGADLQALLGGTRVFGQLLLDDIQIDRRSAGDREPTAYGFTLGFERGLGPAAVTAFYTRVANLAYRTPNPAETVMRRGVGLARNYSDYDQLTVRAGLVTAAGALLTPELTLLRQGEGDFRRPYPPVAAYDTTPGFLAGTVERTLRLGLDARLDRGPLGLAAEVGVHVIDNADHLAGRRDTRVLGRVGLTWRFRKESVLP
ncbi:MAG TPA: hypothetical protein VNI61_00005, partial [Gemmatimonadales bacterium]|nr:hypothetical protein [Gemmatimonadales bacterium]